MITLTLSSTIAMTDVADTAGAILLVFGAAFTMIAALGLFRFKELFARMHAASKPQMLGLMLLCGGMALTFRTWQWLALCTLVVALQMVAAPVASHLLGRTAYRTEEGERGYLAVDDLTEDTVFESVQAQREPGATQEDSSQ